MVNCKWHGMKCHCLIWGIIPEFACRDWEYLDGILKDMAGLNVGLHPREERRKAAHSAAQPTACLFFFRNKLNNETEWFALIFLKSRFRFSVCRCVIMKKGFRFLGAFAKQLRKLSVGFAVSVRPSVRPYVCVKQWTPTERSFVKFVVGNFCWHFSIDLKSDRCSRHVTQRPKCIYENDISPSAVPRPFWQLAKCYITIKNEDCKTVTETRMS